MDLKEIQTLIKFVSSQGVDEVNIERKDFKLSIKKNEKHETVTQLVHAAAPVSAAPQQIAAAPVAPTDGATPAAPAPTPENSNSVEIKSPMIGTFYRRPSPDKELFVNVGDDISSGSVVCIIEAMKLFNEIESEVSGKIVKILVDDQTPVEYDQPLFLVDPS